MNYSKGTNYALHTMLDLAVRTPGLKVGVQDLAAKQGVSPTYLSKILTKLAKAGLVDSYSGAQGGYCLRRDKHDISFLDIIQAIEGSTPLFKGCDSNGPGCLIDAVMRESERKMDEHLRTTTIGRVADEMAAAGHAVGHAH
ncbi:MULTISPECIES: Rrf2 family transcriptional regulator [Saccharibacillus]|uniref:Rrf2 family transcriptional regulator n=1 Tax=Saccharibacillus brassicae TaxID=2583377 RepID=A0A4Y6UV49_SACBS|nr:MULTISPECIES: Rrf2 family transcriptional regulator [Saccharibacillus]MWJ31215.1 Rrf2 family transcriptional regulator [Saccharibacillus sp. WB 17]QDH20448.1 Rrf2 family transcriptional regulator [Saccharibacillus brassicae]